MPSGNPTTIRFNYIKSNFFRVVYTDGAIGGITPNGLIHMALFNERAAIPKELVHSVTQEGKLGPIVETVSREGVVREMEVDVMLSPNAAKLIHTWLGEQLQKFEQLKPVN
jgi:hypothetical protein